MIKRTEKTSFRKHILRSILVLIFSIFIVIYISFNFLVGRYIKIKATSNIYTAIEASQHNSNEVYTPKKYKGERKVHGMVKGQSDVNIINIDKEYKIVNKEQFNISYLDYITEYLKNNNIDLNSEDIVKLDIYEESYYLTFRPCANADEQYVMYFVNVTNEESLWRKMNVTLFLIMSIGAVVAVFVSSLLSSRIVKPINLLCDFADRIGEGKFEKYDVEFNDKEIDKLLKAMNKAATDLDRYDNEQKIFFQNVSHELRTPLMSIKGYAEGIKYDVLDKGEASKIILQEGDRLEELIEELLYISKIDNITKDYILVERDLREILSDCALRQKAIAINKNIEFICDFGEEPCILKCNEKAIYKAFSNIINNGLRYAKEKIILECKKEEDKIIVSFGNDGMHIKEEEKVKIFERFYKGEKGKHGIGLSIVKPIITRHDGVIEVQNVEHGVKFICTFRLRI